MAYAGFGLNLISKAAPFIWGSLQNTEPMQFVYQAAPYMVSNTPPPSRYEYDNQGRLKKIIYSTGITTIYNYDSVGNRTSITTA